jgi:predicted AlkP superfamily pyrophosphatase or phosphodiesterase
MQFNYRNATRFLSFAIAVMVLAGWAPPAERNAILISWDGALRETVQRSMAEGKLPALSSVVRQGSFADIDVVGHFTDTKSGHAQLLTGYDPLTTGVYSNWRFQPIPIGLSIFERLQQVFGKTNIATIMLTGKGQNLGSRPPNQPYLFTRESLTVWDGDENRKASVVGQKAVNYVNTFANRGRFFLFIHFRDPDHAGHEFNEGSAEYKKALVGCDEELGRILHAVKKAGIDERTLIYITADHGFLPGKNHHTDAFHIFLATNDPKSISAGEQRDIVPTILTSMGANPQNFTPALPGKSLHGK